MMITGTALINELVDELNELKLSTMAATLDDLSHTYVCGYHLLGD